MSIPIECPQCLAVTHADTDGGECPRCQAAIQTSLNSAEIGRKIALDELATIRRRLLAEMAATRKIVHTYPPGLPRSAAFARSVKLAKEIENIRQRELFPIAG